MFWRYLVRPVLFSLPAESVHHGSMSLFNAGMFPPVSTLLRSVTCVNDERLKTRVFGIDFQHPVGLAAGFDKQATWFNALRNLGFSHIEVGTITGQAQPGNPAPRLFRLPHDQALINRMGFNNVGAQQAADALSRKKIKTVVGINIGKSKVVDVDKAVEDYVSSFQKLFPFARYFTVNVSSPNTPGLRTLQDREPLTELLGELIRQNHQMAKKLQTVPRPILLKIAPDLNDDQVTDIAELSKELSIDGIIATNTTISRSRLETAETQVNAIGAGGLSGKPLTIKSREMIKRLYLQTDRAIPLVGVGGIMNGSDAWEMICSGASLIQVYTGFIYGGPLFIRKLNRYLIQQVEQNQLENIAEAVGCRH